MRWSNHGEILEGEGLSPVLSEGESDNKTETSLGSPSPRSGSPEKIYGRELSKLEGRQRGILDMVGTRITNGLTKKNVKTEMAKLRQRSGYG